METRTVAITGVGLVSALGHGAAANWEAVAAGRSGMTADGDPMHPPWIRWAGRVADVALPAGLDPKLLGQAKFLNRGALLGLGGGMGSDAAGGPAGGPAGRPACPLCRHRRLHHGGLCVSLSGRARRIGGSVPRAGSRAAEPGHRGQGESVLPAGIHHQQPVQLRVGGAGLHGPRDVAGQPVPQWGARPGVGLPSGANGAGRCRRGRRVRGLGGAGAAHWR